jgi:hypothetical protein
MAQQDERPSDLAGTLSGLVRLLRGASERDEARLDDR